MQAEGIGPVAKPACPPACSVLSISCAVGAQLQQDFLQEEVPPTWPWGSGGPWLCSAPGRCHPWWGTGSRERHQEKGGKAVPRDWVRVIGIYFLFLE